MAQQFLSSRENEHHHERCFRELHDATADTIVDMPLIETYGIEFDKFRRENNVLTEEINECDEQKEKLNTMLEIINELRKKNYIYDFSPEGDHIISKKTGETFKPAELVIDEFYRFEGDSNPDDMSVIYAITSKSGTKGIVVDAYGTYSDSNISDFIKSIPVR